MYLMALVNSTFVGRRPTGHVELVDLSVENKKAVELYKEQNGNLHSYGSQSTEFANFKPSASPRRRALEDQPAADDLCLEPLVFPLFLESPSSDASEADTAQELRMHSMRDTETLPCSREETSVNMAEKTLETASSRQQEPDQELPKSDKQSDMKQAEQITMADTATDGSKTINPSKTRSTPKLGSVFSDAGISTRVQRHPLEMIAGQEHGKDSDSSTRTRGNTAVYSSKKSSENVVRAKIDLSARVLQHPLERIEESPVNDRKRPTMKKERNNGGVPSPQPVRKIVRDAKPDDKEPQKRERAKLRESRAPITKPRSLKLGSQKLPERNDQEKPSLAKPVMEKMQAVAPSPEPPYAWNNKFQNLPKLAVNSIITEPMMEDSRELPHSSPKMTESDAQDDLSFRVWERESKPKRNSVSVSRDFQDSLDLESPNDIRFAAENIPSTPAQLGSAPGKEKSLQDVKMNPQQLNPALSAFDLSRLNRATPNVDVDVQREYPSPSSFTCGLSPTSLFSDDDNMFSTFQPCPDFGPREEATTVICKSSPRSVLSQEPDDVSHFTSDSSIETRESHRLRASSSSMYNDESSDLESTMDGVKNVETELNRRSFSTFTYTAEEMGEMGETSSDEDDRGADFFELRCFQEAGNREPWLEKDGGVLDDTDLQFLLPTDLKDDGTPSIPDVTGIEAPAPVRSLARGGSLRRHSRSSSFSKSGEKIPRRPQKRSVKFAPELVREMSISTSRKPIRLPRSNSSTLKDDDEQIYPSVKSWEVDEEEDTSTTSTPRSRRWRRSPISKPTNITSSQQDQAEDHELGEGSPRMTSKTRRLRRSRDEIKPDDPTSSRRHRVAQILPCAGKFFSWPQRLAYFKACRRLDIDDESIVGTDQISFGRSARRDAQQVRRILKGSQKIKFSNLTVAEILDDGFG